MRITKKDLEIGKYYKGYPKEGGVFYIKLVSLDIVLHSLYLHNLLDDSSSDCIDILKFNYNRGCGLYLADSSTFEEIRYVDTTLFRVLYQESR